MDVIADLSTEKRKEIRSLVVGGGPTTQLVREIVERGQRFGRYMKTKSDKPVWDRIDHNGDLARLSHHLQSAAELYYSKGLLLDKGGIQACCAEVYLRPNDPPPEVGAGPIYVAWSWDYQTRWPGGPAGAITTISTHVFQGHVVPADRLKSIVRWAEVVDRISCDPSPGDRTRAYVGLFGCLEPYPLRPTSRPDRCPTATLHFHQTDESVEVGLAVGIVPQWAARSCFGGCRTDGAFVQIESDKARLPAFYLRPAQALADWQTWVKLGAAISTLS